MHRGVECQEARAEDCDHLPKQEGENLNHAVLNPDL